MIDVPFDQAVRRIHEATNLPVTEIQLRIEAKIHQLGGLVSRDGAVHIIANELGVQLVAAPQQGGQLKISDITMNSRGITVAGRVVKKYDVKAVNTNGREGRVASLLLGDETGVTRLVFWNEQVDVFEQLVDNDILVVRNPFVKESMMKDRLELQLNTQSSLVVNPEGVTVAPRPAYSGNAPVERAPRVQKYIKDLEGNEENVEIIATVLQPYDPRFFDSCPQCNRKLLGGNQCPEHGEVATPGINFSMSAVLDDGTGNIRTSFWKQQALRLTGKSEAEFLKYKDDPAAFEEIKNALLGEFIKVVGRVKHNETFDRMELTANLVFTDVDPIAELKNLDAKLTAERQKQEENPAAPIVEKKQESKPVERNTRDDGLSVVEDEVISLDDLENLDE
jgi:ssDNA-binding replication factor A large subunit